MSAGPGLVMPAGDFPAAAYARPTSGSSCSTRLTVPLLWCPAGAKIVARLAFNKIKELQGALGDYRRQAEARSASVAGLEAAIVGLEAAARQRDAAMQEAEDKLAEVGAG